MRELGGPCRALGEVKSKTVIKIPEKQPPFGGAHGEEALHSQKKRYLVTEVAGRKGDHV